MKTLQRNATRNTELKHLAKTLRRSDDPLPRRRARLAAIMAAVLVTTACAPALTMVGLGPKRPAASEFGLGPRSSANHLYVATLEPSRELRVRQMQTIRVSISGREGRPVLGASLTINGGMPQHGHGLPTKPRMTRDLGAGTYEIEGVRFNMGGWWEFKLTIASELGNDTVTFNLGL